MAKNAFLINSFLVSNSVLFKTAVMISSTGVPINNLVFVKVDSPTISGVPMLSWKNSLTGVAKSLHDAFWI